MRAKQRVDALDCMFGPYRRGGRERTPIQAEKAPVHGRTTIVSLPHVCLAAGLLDNVGKDSAVNWPILSELARKQWEGMTAAFLADIERAGISLESADAWAGTMKGAVVGWTEACSRSVSPSRVPFAICTDASAALAILSRRVGDIFIPNRRPNYDWETLFGTAFGFDEDIVPSADLKTRPWSGFSWALGGNQ